MATTPSATPPSTPTIHHTVNYENLNESWCDIQYKSGCSSSGSISHLHHSVNPEILEKLLQEAQREIISPNTQTKQNSYFHFKDNVFMMPEQLNTTSNNNNNNNKNESHHQIDSSTPMLVTFENSSSPISPIKINIPTSPINKIEDDIAKTLTQFDCTKCFTQKQQIEKLLEKQMEQEKQLNLLRKEYEEKCLSKTPDFMSSSSRSSFSSASLSDDQDEANKKCQVNKIVSSLKRQNSSNTTLVSLTNTNANNNYSSGIYNYNSCIGNGNSDSPDWMKYWSSRPQCQPPKEWNFVHPNSAQSKNIRKMDAEEAKKGTLAKYVNCDRIGKLLFTHMASFIVGATLMFLVIRRHLNIHNSIYMK